MSTKRVLTCRPDYFDVEYSINAWMDVNNPVDKPLANQQWQALVEAYQNLGYRIEIMAPAAGHPDMVFAADNGIVFGNMAVLGHFLYSERQPETFLYRDWLRTHGFKTFLPTDPLEGGDVRVAGDTLFIGYGFRSAHHIHRQVADWLGKSVFSLRLVDKRFYHLDTAFCPLDDQTAMYFPPAFDQPSQELIKQYFPNLIEASEADALAFGLNAVSDGHNVITSTKASGLITQLKQHNFNPVLVDISEFQKSGGGINCLTLELRP